MEQHTIKISKLSNECCSSNSLTYVEYNVKLTLFEVLIFDAIQRLR